MMPPVEQSCYWLARRRTRPADPVAGRVETGLAIVGAGLTGLWTAIQVKELDPAADVVVLEQAQAAYGASGRNAGMLAETVDHSHGLAIEHFGEAEARRLAHLGERNVEEIVGFLARHRIDCDYEPVGRLIVALTPGQLEEARRTVEVARRLGVETFTLLDRDALAAEIRSPLYLGGVAVTGGGILDPVKLVDGLTDHARRMGVRVHERSGVTRLERAGAGIRIETGDGEVRAARAILATSAYSHHLLPRLAHRFIPLYDYVIVSEPLTAPQRETIGWRRRQGVTDGRAFFNYYRLTKDDRILWGTSEAAYHGNNRVDSGCDHSPPHYAALRASFRRHFPQLGEVEFPYAWGGPICSTTRLTPFFGRALGGRVLYGLGFTGHGLGTTRMAGRILAHQALGRDDELLSLAMVRRPPFPYPPEPLRTWAVNAVTRELRSVDAGGAPGVLLRALDRLGLGFSS